MIGIGPVESTRTDADQAKPRSAETDRLAAAQSRNLARLSSKNVKPVAFIQSQTSENVAFIQTKNMGNIDCLQSQTASNVAYVAPQYSGNVAYVSPQNAGGVSRVQAQNVGYITCSMQLQSGGNVACPQGQSVGNVACIRPHSVGSVVLQPNSVGNVACLQSQCVGNVLQPQNVGNVACLQSQCVGNVLQPPNVGNVACLQSQHVGNTACPQAQNVGKATRTIQPQRVGKADCGVLTPIPREVSELKRQEGRSPRRREIRRLVQNLVGNVESMVQNLHGIVEDLHDLLKEIDVVTDKIERQCEKRQKASRRGPSHESVPEVREGQDRAGCAGSQNKRDSKHHPVGSEAGHSPKVNHAPLREASKDESFHFANAQDVMPLYLSAASPCIEQSERMNVSEWSTQTLFSSQTSEPRDLAIQQPCDVILRAKNSGFCDADNSLDESSLHLSCNQPHSWTSQDCFQTQADSKASQRHANPCGSSHGQRLSYFKFSDSDESLPQILSSSTPKDAMEFKFWDDGSPPKPDRHFKESPNSGNMRLSPENSDRLFCIQDHPFHVKELGADIEAKDECPPDVGLQNWREKMERRTGSFDSLTPQMDWSYLGLTEHNGAESEARSTEEVEDAGAIYNYHNGYGVQPGFHQRLVAALPEWRPQQHHLPYWPSSDLSSIKSSDDEDDEETRSQTSPPFPRRSRIPRKLSETVSPLVSRKNYVVSRQTNTQKTVTFYGSTLNTPQSDVIPNSNTSMASSYSSVYENEMENRLEQLSGDERDASDFSDVEADAGSDVFERSVASRDSVDVAYNREVSTWKSYTMTHLDSDDVVSECTSDILNENVIESSTTNPGFDDVKHHYDDISYPALVY
ncbi:hypothetical protein BaRGS_00024256 [Batillaria attramentaria]|uniref:Uncharacterized protein n=1 Tax=Batillaria attramentaria TaxID=370345 RepID=A0ABD0KBN6_9CAEN